MKICVLDFEFFGVSEPKLALVSVCAKAYDGGVLTYEINKWLHQSPAAQLQAKQFFGMLILKDYTFVAYVAEAEARGLHAIFGFMPRFKCIDLYLEYRCLLNHDNKLSYGEQYLNGEVVKTTPPPSKWVQHTMSQDELESDGHHKPSFSLAAATYKLLGHKIDAKEKTEVRDIIIASKPDAINAARDRILKYNATDIDYLMPMMNKIFNMHRRKGDTVENWTAAAIKRGDYAVRTARMIVAGYPVNNSKVDKLISNVKGILDEAIQDCLEYSAEVESFRYDKKQDKYVATEKAIREWVTLQAKPNWRTTYKGKLSISRDAFKDWYDSDSEGFAGAYCRYLKTKQSLNGFMPAKGKRTFKDFTGRDGRVRPFYGIYGSQSSRSQPGATGYIWLKAKWCQNMLEAPKGRALASADFASQEFLVAGIISQDDNMIDSYATGDVYLAFGKLANMIPHDGTKESHSRERDICKTIILGLSYGMSAKGLAPRITQAMGVECPLADAENYVQLFNDSYPEYTAWKYATVRQYEEDGMLQLSDGWKMWGDNDNTRSVTNFMVQGEGACILRESVRLCQDRGLKVIATVHDSIVVDIPSAIAVKCLDILHDSMVEGFENVMKTYGRTVSIRVEGECWSKDIRLPYTHRNFKITQEFIHEKGVKDYERFKKYLV
jgi:hypothetical protein